MLGVVPSSFFSDYGCHVRVLEQARAVQGRGHTVRLVSFPSGDDPAGIDVVRGPSILGGRRPRIGPSLARFPLDLGLAYAALRQARQFRPDVVLGYLHEGALVGSWVARRVGAPLVFDLQGSLAGEMADRRWVRSGGVAWRGLRWVERGIALRARLVLASSRTWADQLSQTLGPPAGRVRALPDCVDTARFAPDIRDPHWRESELDRIGVPRGRAIVVYLGLLGEHQGTACLLEAAARWPRDGAPAHFLIMGYPRVDEYRRLAVSLGVADRVTLLGRVPYDDAPARLALGDVAVAPKLSTSEGHGKLVNYMAMGLPVVAFDHPINREYLGELGRYVPAGDPARLAGALADMLANPIRSHVGLALRARAESRFSCGRIGADLEAALREAVEASGDGARQPPTGGSPFQDPPAVS